MSEWQPTPGPCMLTDLFTSSIRGAPAQTQPGKAKAGPGEGVFAAILGALSRGAPLRDESETEGTEPPPPAEEVTEAVAEEGDATLIPAASGGSERAPESDHAQMVAYPPLAGLKAGGEAAEPFLQISVEASEDGEAARPSPDRGEKTTVKADSTPQTAWQQVSVNAETEATPGKPLTGEPLLASKSVPETPLTGPLPTTQAASQGVAPPLQSAAESAAGRAGQASIAASALALSDATDTLNADGRSGRAPEGMPVRATVPPSAQGQTIAAQDGPKATDPAPAKATASARADGVPLTSSPLAANVPLTPTAGLQPTAREPSLSPQPVLSPDEAPVIAAALPPLTSRGLPGGASGPIEQTKPAATEPRWAAMTKPETSRMPPAPGATVTSTAPSQVTTLPAHPLASPDSATGTAAANMARAEADAGGLFLPSGDSPLVAGAAPGTGSALSLTESATAQRPTAELARDVSQQIGAQVLAAGKGRFELSLAPAELGKVEMWLQENDNRLTLSVSAERPETMDLIRRHIGLLEQELRQMGFNGLSLQLGTNGAPGSHAGRTRQNLPAAEGIAAPVEPLRRAANAALAGERLDIRL